MTLAQPCSSRETRTTHRSGTLSFVCTAFAVLQHAVARVYVQADLIKNLLPKSASQPFQPQWRRFRETLTCFIAVAENPMRTSRFAFLPLWPCCRSVFLCWRSRSPCSLFRLHLAESWTPGKQGPIQGGTSRHSIFRCWRRQWAAPELEHGHSLLAERDGRAARLPGISHHLADRTAAPAISLMNSFDGRTKANAAIVLGGGTSHTASTSTSPTQPM